MNGSPQLKVCLKCGIKNKLTLEERRYTCGCGYSEERRDRKAAYSIRHAA
ncbi:MAG: transposase [Spirochaetaceae bacterium]|nr:transposase [Spirochaetaceae bacterium]